MTEINQTNTVLTEIQTLICSLANVGQNTHFHDFVSLCCLTLSLPQVTKTEFLLTMSIQYQAGTGDKNREEYQS